MLLKSGNGLTEAVSEFVSNSENLFILSPYLKSNTLSLLLKKRDNCKLVVVRWEARDLIFGSSDLDVYEYCIENGISLYRNPRLHLKAFLNDYRSCLLGSANISARGLNIPNHPNYNYELATIVDSLQIEDRLYFSKILQDSHLITQPIFEQIKDQLKVKQLEFPRESDFALKVEYPDKNFLISSLPMSYSVQSLTRICEQKEAINEVELNCAMHDLALYDLPLGIPENELRPKLKVAFFSHPFIQAFLENLNQGGEIYFGSAKEWIHQNCTDVPTPRKWEITENIQILYKWIVDLGDGRYKVDIPGKHSERLSINN